MKVPRSQISAHALSGIFAVIAAIFTTLAAPALAFTIQSFSPQGEAPDAKQVVVTFSEDMVRFGDAKAPAPFTISCPEAGHGYWINGKRWAYDFKQALPAGLNCQFAVNKDLRSLSNQPYSGPASFQFVTGGPNIIETAPWYYGVYEDQAFIFTLNSDYDPATLQKHTWFNVPGIASPIGIKLITGSLRDSILKEHFRGREKPTDKLLANIVIIQPITQLPAGAAVELVFGKGVTTRSGVARTTPQIKKFETRPAFKASLSCDRENAKADCIPFSNIRLNFAAPITREAAKEVHLQANGSSHHAVELDTNQEEELIYSLTFKGPFAQNATYTLSIPPKLVDDSGRELINAKTFPLTVKTGNYPALVKFPGTFGILESKANPVLPVTIRHVESELSASIYAPLTPAGGKPLYLRLYDFLRTRFLRLPTENAGKVMAWLDRLHSTEREQSIFSPEQGPRVFEAQAGLEPQKFDFKQEKVSKKHGDNRTEVIGLPLPKPGFYVMEIESRLLGEALLDKPKPMYVSTAVLVTNMAVHFKRGAANSLVWVTSLDKGEPVSGALVSIWDCNGKRLWKGPTNKNGLAMIATELPPEDKLGCNTDNKSNYAQGFMAVAEKDDDFSFVHTSWNEGLEPWRFQLPYNESQTSLAVHTVFDRGLYKPEETIHMKHIIRQRTMTGFAPVPREKQPKKLVLRHSGSDQTFTMDVTWDENGSAENSFTVPPEARLGQYNAYFLAGEEDVWNMRLPSGDLRIDEFRVPLASGRINPPKGPLITPKTLSFDVAVNYLDGGAASNLPVVFRSRDTGPTPINFSAFEGYTFASEPVKVGIIHQQDQEAKPATQLISRDLVLDKSGSAHIELADLPMYLTPYRLESELEFRDPNGEIQTTHTAKTIFPADRLLGIKAESWALVQDKVKLYIAAVDLDGKPQGGTKISVHSFNQKTHSHRKRLVGGFYAYEHTTEVEPLDLFCEGETDSSGILICENSVKNSGSIIFEATSSDTNSRRIFASTTAYIAGKDEWWFGAENHDRIDVLPEKKYYEPGSKARLQIRSPLQKAKALVTTEREGILDAFIIDLDNKSPVVEVPITPAYAPNIFVSILAVRGRLADPAPGFIVDLAKPTFKLGMTALKVGFDRHKLKVEVKTDKQTYETRSEVQVTVQALPSDGSALPKSTEVILAVVDEGLLALRPNTSFDLLQGMMGERSYQVNTYTASMHVVGKRHFGVKAVPDGGGGGGENTRTLFDTLVHWQTKLALDKNGRATTTFKLKDSLTAFRVVAVAVAGSEHFGTGSTTINTTRDVIVLPGLPIFARSGDRYKGLVTVRNTTAQPKTLNLTLALADEKQKKVGKDMSKTLQVPAQGSAEATFDIQVPDDETIALSYHLLTQENNVLLDELKITQKILPSIPARAFQADLVPLAGSLSLPVAAPAGALPGRGGLELQLTRSMIGSLQGVDRYMENYPYVCLEQRLSQAVTLNDQKAWARAIATLPAHTDDEGFAKYYPSSTTGDPVLTAYVLQIAHASGFNLPEESRDRLLGALEGFAEGQLKRSSLVSGPDLDLRKLISIEALSRYGRAGQRFLSQVRIAPQDWPTSTVIDWLNILKRTEDIKERASRQSEAEKILRARLVFRGSEAAFSTEAQDRLYWLMISPDVNGVRLLLSLMEFDLWKEEWPKLWKGVRTRQGSKGHWDLTTANAYGALAARQFAQNFESEAVSGLTTASLATHTSQLDWPKHPKGGSLNFPWPEADSKLEVKHEGTGKPWVTLVSHAAIPLQEPVSHGYTIKKEILPFRQREPGSWHLSDVYKVRLTITALSDMAFVVINDPLPTGVSVLGSGLGGDDAAATRSETIEGLYPIYRETGRNALKAYYDYVPAGNFVYEYTVRLNNPGVYKLPPTRVEAMYAPDAYGEAPNQTITVKD